MTLQLRTFGAVCLERDGAPVAGPPAQKRRLALLAYLALAGDAPVTRDKLMAVLWPERDAARGRHSLSQLLYALRQQLPADAILATGDVVRLDSTLLPSDVRAFTDALGRGDDERMLDLYRGAFLDGFFLDDAPDFEEWAEQRRAQFAHAYGAALDRLATRAEQRGEPFRVLEFRRLRVAHDPADAAAVLRLMHALAALRDYAGAAKTARAYDALMREQGDAPDPRVMELLQRMQHEVRPAPAEPVVTTNTIEQHVVARPRVRKRNSWPWLAGATLLVTFILVMSTRGQPDAGNDEPANAVTVLVGHLDGPDAELALAVREALRAELSSEATVTQISDLRAQEVQTLMGSAALAALRPPQLLEVALRSGAHIVVAGSAAPLGQGAQLRIDLIDPATGNVVKMLSARATDTDGVLPAVATIGRQLRAAILAVPVDTTIRALPAVTTWSLPALKSYALARRAAEQGWRDTAVYHAERAVTHDTAFALAHYLAGDLLWFMDRQSHAEAHLTRAHDLSADLPLRERLLVRARYQQLVLDRPDSALTYWDLLRDAAPNDAVGNEGRAWTLRALGRYEEAAIAAEESLRLEPAAVLPNASNALFSLLSVGDTTGALAVGRRIADRWPSGLIEAQFHAALMRDDVASALRIAGNMEPANTRNALLFDAYLVGGDRNSARKQLALIRQVPDHAHWPRSLIAHGSIELCREGDTALAAAHARAALKWISEQDLSPPALARLAERIGDLAARAGDRRTIEQTSAVIRARDRGRALPSYVLAQKTLDAARAYASGDMRAAAQRAQSARYGVYFSRSLNTVVNLEADARRAMGDVATADSLRGLVRSHQIADGDFWTWIIVRAMTYCGGSRPPG